MVRTASRVAIRQVIVVIRFQGSNPQRSSAQTRGVFAVASQPLTKYHEIALRERDCSDSQQSTRHKKKAPLRARWCGSAAGWDQFPALAP